VGFYSKQRAYKRVQTISMLHHVVVVEAGEVPSLVSFQVFHSSPCMTCFDFSFTHLLTGLSLHATGDRIRS
jgi:hypothetical protein